MVKKTSALNEKEGISNYSILASHVLVPPAMEAILDDKLCTIDAFLAAGHVCAIMGIQEYYPLVEKYKIPIVVTGFEPLDLVQGIYMAIKQLEKGQFKLENQYSRIVKEFGNLSFKILYLKQLSRSSGIILDIRGQHSSKQGFVLTSSK